MLRSVPMEGSDASVQGTNDDAQVRKESSCLSPTAPTGQAACCWACVMQRPCE